MLLFAWALWQSGSFGWRAGLFPWAVTVPALFLAIMQFVRDLAGRPESPGPGLVEATPSVPSAVAGRRTAEIAAWIVAMFAAIWLVGFAGATLLTTFLYLKLGAREGWMPSLALSLGGFVFVYGLFERALGVPFPPGGLLTWLGYG